MNSEEGMSMAKMAVTVLLVVLVIGAVVGIVYAAYSWFGSGTDKLSDNVSSISDTALSQYDDAVVSGDDVLAALKNFRNGDIGVYVCNLKNQNGRYDATASSVSAMNYCAVSSAWSQSKSPVTVEQKEIGTTGMQWSVPSLKADASKVSTVKNTNFSPTTTKSEADCFVKKSAQWYANLVYDQSTGDICGILFRQMG